MTDKPLFSTEDLKSRSQMRRLAIQNPDALVVEIERLREALEKIDAFFAPKAAGDCFQKCGEIARAALDGK